VTNPAFINIIVGFTTSQNNL